MTDGVTELVRAGLRNAVRITVKVERVKSKESQRTPTQYDRQDERAPVQLQGRPNDGLGRGRGR